MNRKEFFQHRLPLYRKDPVLFFKEVLKFYPDPWQENAARDLAGYPKVTIRSGQGVGKTAFQAACLLWFLCCFPYPRIVATAPTRQQLNDVLWSEVAKWQERSPLLSKMLKWTKTYIYMIGMEKRWFAVARTATKPENMQGFHEDNMLFIVDEASGVADPIMEAVLGTLSGANNKLLMCGNPTQLTGIFHDSHTGDRAMYKVHRVSSRESPRTSKENIEALERKYGKDSNVVRVRVDGEFPLAEDDVFIPITLVEKSINTEIKEQDVPFSIHIACDVARFGDDKTVIGYKVDEHAGFYKKYRGQDLMKTADYIIELGEKLIRRYKYTHKIPVKVDDGGLGGGVTDRLRQLKRLNPERYEWLEVFPVHFGVRIKNRNFHDTTSYMMGIVKNLLMPYDDEGKPKPVELVLPNDNDLVAQLSTRKYNLTDNGKIKVESKDEVKKRNSPSPDEADCVLLLCLPVKIKNERRDKR